MAKYTDEQIKKALELCDNWKSGDCLNCPLADECEKDSEVLIHNSLDLINRKEAEIERLRKSNEELASESDARDIDETWLIARAKSEAIKEFAERLKKSAFDCDVSFGFGREHYTEAVTVFEIDNLVNEMVGEGE